MVIVTLHNELFYVFSASVPEAEDIVYEALENERPIRASLLRICVSIFAIKMLAKATAIFVPKAVLCV